ncbi:hypothetical protein [Microscilla marina]|uniref:Lipoprotein, putative n=1 Tax=Microscilla marina ATCC 23134 TaxID=313606 RepID=A1ZT46_MICM2|nr:hypothetical protein [Microscilla marina]EAY26436.1 lipoprotein, putative [Microscilla marina ATCC 23134]
MKVLIYSFLCWGLWVACLPAQAQTTQQQFVKRLRGYQVILAKQYIKESGGMLPDTTSPAALIANEKIGIFAKMNSQTAEFILGGRPYAYNVQVVQWSTSRGKKFWTVIRYLANYGEPSKPIRFKDFKIIDLQFRNIKAQVLPKTTMTRWQQAYEASIKKNCDNYKGQKIGSLDDPVSETMTLSLGYGGTTNDRAMSFTVRLRYKTRYTVCTLFMGELMFNKTKGIFEFKAY